MLVLGYIFVNQFLRTSHAKPPRRWIVRVDGYFGPKKNYVTRLAPPFTPDFQFE